MKENLLADQQLSKLYTTNDLDKSLLGLKADIEKCNVFDDLVSLWEELRHTACLINIKLSDDLYDDRLKIIRSTDILINNTNKDTINVKKTVLLLMIDLFHRELNNK